MSGTTPCPHPDSRIQWQSWLTDPETGRYRLVVDRCVQCDAVLSVAAITEAEWFRWRDRRAG